MHIKKMLNGISTVIVVITILIAWAEVDADVLIGFGDSITKGTPYVEEREGMGRRVGGYEPVLEGILADAGKPSIVYNWGIAGENTVNGYDRLAGVLSAHPGASHVLIMEGTNDFTQYSVGSTIEMLGLMIDRSRAHGIEPVIATLPPDTSHGGEKQYAIATQYNPMIWQLASSKGVIVADMYAALVNRWGALSADGIHPNRTGYKVIANVWAEALTKPFIRTDAPLYVTKTGAMLNGAIRPNDHSIRYYFEYGQTTAYGQTTKAYALDTTQGEATVSVDVSSLAEDTTYHYRLIGKSSGETYSGGNMTFTTGNSSSPSNGEGSSGGGCFITTIMDF
jgi:lysophospholipase L1-like esterase